MVQAADHLIQERGIHPGAHHSPGDSQLVHARYLVERGRDAELSLDRDPGQVPQVGQGAGLHRLALANDRHPVRHRLGLGQDIAIPLGRRHDMPPRAAAAAASRVLTMRWPPPLPAARKVAGFRLTATDTPWSFGEGPQISGPMGALLLVCAGRLAPLPQLSGEGAAALAARLSTTPPPPAENRTS